MNKGLIFDIKRFAVHDGPGIRTTVFFKGCPLSCWWCHNPESRSGNPQVSLKRLKLEGKTFDIEEVTGREVTVEALVREVLPDRIYFEESGGGVTLSGGEPLFQPDFCAELLLALKEKNVHTALDTTGFASEDEIRRILPYTDLFLYDVKLMDDALHRKYTGVSNKSILENLKLLLISGKQVIIRFPVIPGITDTKENLTAVAAFLSPYRDMAPQDSASLRFPESPLEIHLLPFHSIASNKYRRFRMENAMKAGLSVNRNRLEEISSVFQAAGFSVSTGG